MSRRIAGRAGVLALMVFALALLAGCTTGDSVIGPAGGQQDAPALPDVSTMKFQFGFFGEDDLAEIDTQSLANGRPSKQLQAVSAERTNWINAVVRAIFIQLAVYDALEEPIAAFVLAVHSVPQKQDDGSWLWTYVVVEEDVEYIIYLYGTPLTNRVLWRMEVSSNDPDLQLDHFVWFDGEAMNDDSEGFWQFYGPVEADAVPAASLASNTATDGAKTIRIDWYNTSARDHRLRITVNGEGLEDEGDWLEFHENPTSSMIDYYDASEDLASNITWYTDGSGSLTVPDYNDGAKACWDAEQQDTVCP